MSAHWEYHKNTIPLEINNEDNAGSPLIARKNSQISSKQKNEEKGDKKKVVVDVIRALSAEFVGSFFLMLIGVGTSISEHSPNEDERITYASKALVMAGITIVMNYTLTVQSGSIFNPAVTFALVLVRKLSILRGLAYVSAQIIGSICGAYTIKLITPHHLLQYLDEIPTTLSVTIAQGVAIEGLLTSVVVMVVLFVSVSPQAPEEHETFKPFIIGAAIVACDIFAGPLTGSSHNPARSIGPAIVTNIWENHWIYWLGSLLGTLASTLFYMIHHTKEIFGTKY